MRAARVVYTIEGDSVVSVDGHVDESDCVQLRCLVAYHLEGRLRGLAKPFFCTGNNRHLRDLGV